MANLSDVAYGWEMVTGVAVDTMDIAAIRKALNLGFTTGEIAKAAKQARKFYFLTNSRASRNIVDRLAAKVVLKDAQTIRGFLTYDECKAKTVSSLRDKIQSKKLYDENVQAKVSARVDGAESGEAGSGGQAKESN